MRNAKAFSSFFGSFFGGLFSSLVILSIALSPAHAKAELKAKDAQAEAAAKTFTGFVNVGKNRALYVDYIKPAPGKPIAVLLNGLTYRLGCWDDFVAKLQGQGLGILRYDMYGQGETLLKYAPIQDVIPLQDQVDDLGKLLSALKIDEPVHLVTLSYGAAVGIPFTAQQPSHVASLILMAPFVSPIPQQDQWIHMQIDQTRFLYPTNPASYDDLYDYFLHIIVYQTYPSAEPIVLENPYKLEATFRLVQGARKFIAKDYINQLPAGKIHLMVATKDQYVPAALHEDFWNQLPANTKLSRLFIEGSEHKIPEVLPGYSADWVKHIIAADPQISQGRTFIGDTEKGTATSDSIVIGNLGK
jgi:pimeloyl-ACP methyl ester carboxylesterase